jgi:acetyl esterase
MAIALTQLAEQRNLNIKIAHFVLFYPLVITEIPKRTQTYTTYHDGPYLLVDTLDWMIDAFLPNQEDRKNSLTSPLWYASKETLAKFPPTTIFVSGADPLVDEGLLFGQRLQEAGVECVIIQAYGQIHDYVMLEPTRKSATAKAVVELAALKLKNALWE